jgi:uncharacterized protein
LLILLYPAVLPAGDPGRDLAEAAKQQIGVTLRYDGAYRKLAYPKGDVPADRGVCTDVIVRAYRRFGIDLQRLVHEDMASAWSEYPKWWRLSSPDANIDHRRVPNLAVFFKRRGQSLSVQTDKRIYLTGDIVTWRLASGVPHIGFVSDLQSPSGVPLIIHNIGRGTVQEDRLFDFKITGHYRYLPFDSL